MHSLEHKNKASLSIKKAKGNISKILEMIKEDKYCPEIIQQVDAVIGLLESSKKTLLRGHLHHCLENNMQKDKDEAIEELLKILKLK